MIQFPSFPHRKIFLTALALVIVSVTVLLGQPPPQTVPSLKEAVQLETGQEQKFQTDANGFISVLAGIKSKNVSATDITIIFRDSRSGLKIFPQVVIEYVDENSNIRQEMNMEKYHDAKGLSMSLPNGELYFSMKSDDYKVMVLPITLKDQGTLTYSVNLTPVNESKLFSDKRFEELAVTGIAVIIGTLVDAESGRPVTNGRVSTLDGKHHSILGENGYFHVEIPKEDTRVGTLDQNVNYTDLVLSAPGYETRIIKNQPTWFGSVTSLEGTRISPGGGINETELDEIGATSLHKALEVNSETISIVKEPVGNTTGSFTESGFPWNNCVPQTIIVGFKNQNLEPCCVGGCDYYTAYDMNEYIRHVIPAEWLPSWQANYGSSAQQAYIAGVVAIRSYCIQKILVQPSSPGYYHICSNACCQAFGATNQFTNQAVNSNTTSVLTYNNSVAKAEFSSENNNKTPECFAGSNTGCGCADGQVGSVNPSGGCGNFCINDIVGTGKKLYGHGRGMSQYGSARWATGYNISGPCTTASNQPTFNQKTWQQIISQYYPNLTKVDVSRCVFDCANTTTIACGIPINGSTIGLGNNINTYGGYLGWNETGPEKIYKIVTTSIGTITATLSNVSYIPPGTGNDLDVFILKSASGSCASINPLSDCVSSSSGLVATYSNAPAGTYFIVVEGFNGSSGSYTLNVAASCGGGGSGFNCNNAVALSNGVAYNGNNSGGGSNVINYNCSTWPEIGPEKVHSFNHTGGTISVNLAQTGGVDVDAFLLASCSPTNCLLEIEQGVVTTSTSQPAGTYYVVVDGYQGAAGNYNLTVTSSGGGGGFSCNNAVALTNGVAYNGNNTGGGNNVTTYNCQPGWSETGPEKVHSYYHTGGTITVNLAQSVDVDVFLLGSCSANNCLLGFDNGVASSSQPAGTYYIVVDGYLGAVGSYTLTVSSSGGGGGVVNNNPCEANTLSVGSTCSYTNSTNVGATTTTNPSANTMCGESPGKDVWFKTTIPASGIMTIRTAAGSLTDALMALYTGSCSSLSYTNICEDDNSPGNGSLMPVISVTGPVGTVVYIRIWGYGGSSGTFSICVLNYNSQNFGDDGGDIVSIDPSVGDRGQSAELTPTRQLIHSCEVSVNGSDISVSNVDPKSEYILLNTVGQVICQGKATGGDIRCSVNITGVYFISIVDGMGNKCVQKIFVN